MHRCCKLASSQSLELKYGCQDSAGSKRLNKNFHYNVPEKLTFNQIQ